ncbi:MAG: tRNA lysidine(34) synthetase TilS [Paludibacter sp.]|nr:tRNA lysidine(34) synthetase TilS [Paludibacter sp.]
MLQKVAAFIVKNNLLVKSKPVIVALSGGADSVALFDILQKLEYECVVAHCNFQLRGDESQRDENFVRELCRQNNVTLFVQHFETEQFAKDNKISIEMAARQLRYQWFEELLLQMDAQAIAVAHHKDDNIETFLLNIIRGTGLKGLRGISVKNDKIVRPLLSVNRSDIENYIKVNNLNFVTDSTNFENKFKRNRIRNEILPLLQTLNPSAKDTILEEINVFNGIYDIYKKTIENIKNQIVIYENDIVKILIDKLLEQQQTAIILFEILKEFGFNISQTNQIFDSLNSISGKTFYSKTHKLIKDREFMIIKEKELNKNDDEYIIDLDYNEILNPIHLKFEKIINYSDLILKTSSNIIQIDYNKIKFPLKIRRWKNGDWFYPFGMKTRQKLSDFFINNKLSIFEKNNTWLLISGDKIVWVIGLRADNRFKINKKTKKILEITLF